jgi:drug/metabolite transporter (DMT)-like permease
MPPLVFVLLWTFNNLVTKLSAGSVDPRVMGFGRFAVAVLVLTPFVLRPAWRMRWTIRPHLPKLALLGLLGMAIAQGTPYFAARTLSATTIGLITAFIPLLTLLMSGLLLAERPRPLTLLGALISLTGIGLLFGRGDITLLARQGIGEGEVVGLLGCLSYATYSVLLKRWSLPIPTWPSIYLQLSFAALFMLPAALLAPMAALSLNGVAFILYAGVMASAIGPALWMRGIGFIGPSRMTNFTNLVPVLTAAAAVALLGEPAASVPRL